MIKHHAEGSAPTAERTVNPAGASRESLTSNPELENSLDPNRSFKLVGPCPYGLIKSLPNFVSRRRLSMVEEHQTLARTPEPTPGTPVPVRVSLAAGACPGAGRWAPRPPHRHARRGGGGSRETEQRLRICTSLSAEIVIFRNS